MVYDKHIISSEKFTGNALISLMLAFLAFLFLLYLHEASDPNKMSASRKPEKNRHVVYEAVFMKNEEVLEVFRILRGEIPPYEHIPAEYHVTTIFEPETDSRQYYGSDVAIHGYVYKTGEVIDDDGNLTGNEGVLVKMYSSNPGLQKYIENITNRVWHITGSYAKEAKYTKNLDFDDGTPVNFTITGTFGAMMDDGSFVFSKEETDSYFNAPD